MSDITILNVITGEEISRDYTEEERINFSNLRIDGEDEINSIILEQEQKNILKQEALEILQNLGLSEGQAKAIAGL